LSNNDPSSGAPEPKHGFEDSRRLTGPNRWYANTAVVLTPLGGAAHQPAAHALWAQHVVHMARALAWPDPQPKAVEHAHEPSLAFAAPADVLFTATEVNEWAWERAAAGWGAPGFDLAQDWGDAATTVFAARAQAERRPDLAVLQSAAATRGLPCLVDDELGSIGAGAGSRSWPLQALPALDAVPWSALHNIPTALVTGSNGKTTTVRLLAAMVHAAGHIPGLCSTEGVVVDGLTVQMGDYAGPAGARAVLRHPAVQVALLETARGGILRRGLAVQRATVAVVTNVSADHLGEYGVASAADIAEVKLVVAHAVNGGAGLSGAGPSCTGPSSTSPKQAPGVLVLNAEDALLMATAARLPHARSARWALFAQDHDHPTLAALRARPEHTQGSTCGVRAGQLLLCAGGLEHDLGAVHRMPISLQGAARHNIENAAAAALAAHALGLPISAIQQALHSFGASPQDNPGRLELWHHHGATVLIDYAHNPDGLAQLLRVARSLKPQRLGLLLGQAGNRSDAAISELAQVAASFQPDRVVIKELPLMLRGRSVAEVPALIERALLGQGVAAALVHHVADEAAAAMALLAWAQPGDVLVLPIHTAAVRTEIRTALAAAAQPR
jgi:cyanophycin synthetase